MAGGEVLMDGPSHEVFSNEALLGKAHLIPPAIVRLGNRLGVTTLSIEEFLHSME